MAKTTDMTLRALLRGDPEKLHHVQCPHCTKAFSIDRVYHRIIKTLVSSVLGGIKVRVSGVGKLDIFSANGKPSHIRLIPFSAFTKQLNTK